MHSSSRPSVAVSPSNDRPWCDPRSTSMLRPGTITRAARGASSSSTTDVPSGSDGTHVATVNTAPTSASPSCRAIVAGDALQSSSRAPRPSEAASATRKAGPLGSRIADRLPASARTKGADRCRSVTPAAASCEASKGPSRPPPAAMARGSSASGSDILEETSALEGRVPPP